jgi:hypothetical protein
VRQDFSTTYEDSIGSIFQPWETGYYMRATRKQNAIKIFAYPTGKYHSAYSPYALNELNLALSQLLLAQHEKLFKFFLSILDRMQ